MMKLFTLLALCLLASAAPSRRETAPCTFVMNAVGTVQGSVKETYTGENCIGGVYQQGTYFFTDGTLFDSLKHNCVVDTAHALQCTTGVSSTIKLSVNELGNLAHDDSDIWLACPPAVNDGSHVIYSSTKADTTGCQTITLRTGGYSCTALGQPPISAAPVCPSDLSSGNFQYPNLIIPTSPQNPDTAYGNSYKAYISSSTSTLFNFDIPPNYAGLTCALLFLFPYGNELDPSAGKFYFSGIEQEVLGKGGFDFAQLSAAIGVSETYRSTPSVAVEYGKTQVLPGNKYVITRFKCPAGRAVSYRVSSVNGVELDYLQDSAPAAIGLYIVPCVD